MPTVYSLTDVSRKPAWMSGMQRFSKVREGALAALALVLMSFGASAHAGDGPYVGIGGGLSILNDSGVTAPGDEPYTPLNVNATTDNGFAVRGMAGYAFPSGFRLEGEIDYRKHNTDQMNVRSPGSLVLLQVPNYADLPSTAQMGINAQATGTTQPVNGNFSMLAFMGNVDYDFDTGSQWVPYVGGGLGLAIISLDAESAQGMSLVDDSDSVFAYQVGAGLGYEFPLPEGRSVTVSLDWRYFGTQDPTFAGDVRGGDFDAEISGHDIGLGLIYGF